MIGRLINSRDKMTKPGCERRRWEDES